MKWTAYLDESGTHDSPIMLMGGYVGNTEQWDAFNQDWQDLLKSSGIESCHGKDLEHGAKQFKGWPREKRESFRLNANEIVERTLAFGVTAIIRQNDYDSLYRSAPNPQRLREDTKYGVLFRASLLRIESTLAYDRASAKDFTLDIVMEDGAKNKADAPRLFELAKREHLPGWEHLLGTLTFGQKQIAGLQAADLLAYYASRLEREHHGNEPTAIEHSPYVLSAGQSIPKFVNYRLPVTQDTLQHLRADFQLPPNQWANMQSK